MVQISVIIPVYNTKLEDLYKCIKSLLDQTYSKFEILIIDDGSKIEIANRLDDLEKIDNKIKVYHKQNEGVSVARNFGVSCSSGEYITFVDGDDVLTPWAFEQGLNAIKNSGADIAIGRIIQTSSYPSKFPTQNSSVLTKILETDKDKLEFEEHIYLKNINDWGINDKKWMFNPEGCWSHLIKKEVAEKCLFIRGLAIAEDTVWAVSLLRNDYKICLVDDLWYYYIQNEGSVLHRYSPNLGSHIGQAINELNPLYETVLNYDLYNAYLHWVLSKLKQIIIQSYLHKDCNLKWFEKYKTFKKMLNSTPWKIVIKPKKQAYFLFRLKFLMYRVNLMMLIFSIKEKRDRFDKKR